jgi:hypothetical protein
MKPEMRRAATKALPTAKIAVATGIAAAVAVVVVASAVPATAASASHARAASASHKHRHKHPRKPRELVTCPGAKLPHVTVSPLPGAPEAPSGAQISFLGASVSELHAIHVIGSITGPHPGSLRSYASQTGVSFIPETGFAEGEHVTVCAALGRGRHTRHVATSFQVARTAHLKYEAPFEVPGTRRDDQGYHSVDLKPPAITVTRPAGALSAPGDIFLTPYAGPAGHGAMIFNDAGELVWFHRPPNPDWGIANLQVQTWQGQQDLVWWQGMINSFGFGTGEDVIANSAYEQVASVRGGNGLAADMHAVALTASGAAYITVYEPVRVGIPASGRSKAPPRSEVVLDSAVQEIDVKTGLVMWEWQSLGHVPLSQSRVQAPASGPYDYFHIDSLQPLSGGKLLIDARNVWGVYGIAPHSGQIAWQIGTAKSTLALDSGVRFGWPEDAQMLPGEQLALYDGGAQSAARPRGEVLDLEWSNKEASLDPYGQLGGSFGTPRGVGEGSIQPLAGGNWLVGFEGLPNIAEFDSEGNVIYEAQMPPAEVGYRAYREPWQGQPTAVPNLLADTQGAATTSYVSWNGATDVASWRLFGGSSAHTLEALATVPVSGFETSISTPPVNVVLAQALNAAGEVIGESKVITAERT